MLSYSYVKSGANLRIINFQFFIKSANTFQSLLTYSKLVSFVVSGKITEFNMWWFKRKTGQYCKDISQKSSHNYLCRVVYVVTKYPR